MMQHPRGIYPECLTVITVQVKRIDIAVILLLASQRADDQISAVLMKSADQTFSRPGSRSGL